MYLPKRAARSYLPLKSQYLMTSPKGFSGHVSWWKVGTGVVLCLALGHSPKQLTNKFYKLSYRCYTSITPSAVICVFTDWSFQTKSEKVHFLLSEAKTLLALQLMAPPHTLQPWSLKKWLKTWTGVLLLQHTWATWCQMVLVNKSIHH